MSNPNQPFHQAFVSGEDINRLCEAVEQALIEEDATREETIVSLLTIVSVAMCPNITEDDLGLTVKGMSEWLCLFLTGRYDDPTSPGTIPKEKLN